MLRLFLISAALTSALTSVAGWTMAAPPTLTHLYPAGGQRGVKFTTTCKGEFEWPVAIWAPGLDARPLTEAGQIELTVPSDLAADRVWIRLYNSEGASTLQPLLIGSLPEMLEQEPNNRAREAQKLASSRMTINGILQEGGDVDSYAVSLSSGETLVAALDANTRLGSPMDAILQIVRPDGFVVAENHDDLGLDPLLTYTATTDGTYIVRVFAFPSEPDTTIAFRGAPSYVYRLTVTTGPFVRHADPLAVSSSASPAEVTLRGWNLSPSFRLPVKPWGTDRLAGFGEWEATTEASPPNSQWGIAFDDSVAGAARVRISETTTVERAGAAHGTIQVLPPSASTTGWLDGSRQVDEYKVPLQQGQPFVASIEGPAWYLPTMPKVQLLDPAGQLVAEVAESAAPQDAVIRHTPAQSGDFLLRVSDRFRQSGDRYFYHVTTRIEATDFDLSVATDSLTIAPDRPGTLDVTIKRRAGSAGTVGAIRIEVVGLPPEITATSAVSEASGATAEKVTLTLQTNGKPYSGPIRIRGVADDPVPRLRWARTPARLGASFESIWLTGTRPTAAAPK